MFKWLRNMWRAPVTSLRDLDICDPCVHIDKRYKSHWLMEGSSGTRWVTACKWSEWDVSQWENAWPIRRVIRK